MDPHGSLCGDLPALPIEIVQMILLYRPHAAIGLCQRLHVWACEFISALPGLRSCLDFITHGPSAKQLSLIMDCNYVKLSLYMTGKYSTVTGKLCYSYGSGWYYVVGRNVFYRDGFTNIDYKTLKTNKGQPAFSYVFYRGPNIYINSYPVDRITYDNDITIYIGHDRIFSSDHLNSDQNARSRARQYVPELGPNVVPISKHKDRHMQIIEFVAKKLPEYAEITRKALHRYARDIVQYGPRGERLH